jgi:mRNA deadenylase 3'-5' endonuclease subunit Ccr4
LFVVQVPSPDDKIVVANTHLLFNPRRGDIKLAQFMVLMAEIDKHAYMGPDPSHSTHSSANKAK